MTVSNRSANHLDYLDGIRGLCAFYVLLDHAYLMLLDANIGQNHWTQIVMMTLRPLAFGRYAVDMFIVLSGYCLMLPVVRSGGGLRGGFIGYIKRRARRIIPPYYAALFLSILLLFVRHTWFLSAGTVDESVVGFPSWGNLLTHLLLVHNLFDHWAHSINSPMWSVASEWQIYFVFPALLLPVWRKWNVSAAVAAGFGVGYALHLLVSGGLEGAAPWYIGLFALGMSGAVFTSRAVTTGLMTVLDNAPWGAVAVGTMLSLAVVGTVARGWFRTHAWLIDPIFGCAAVSGILWYNRASFTRTTSTSRLLLRVLSSRVIVALGSFSYSLYLIHYPFVELSATIFRYFALAPSLQIVLTFGVCIPSITATAYLFHVVAERPFMIGKPRNLRESETLAMVSPAP